MLFSDPCPSRSCLCLVLRSSLPTTTEKAAVAKKSFQPATRCKSSSGATFDTYLLSRMMEGCNVLCSSTTHPSSPKAEKEKLPSNATGTSKWYKFKKCSNARRSATEFCRGVSVTSNRFADESPAKYLRSALSLFYGRCTSSSAIKCDGVTVEPRNYGMNF